MGGILGFLKAVILFLPALVGDGADGLGSSGFVKPDPFCAPQVALIDRPEGIFVWWEGPDEFWVEVRDPRTDSLWRERRWPYNFEGDDNRPIEARRRHRVQIVALDGKCRCREVQVPWSPKPEPETLKPLARGEVTVTPLTVDWVLTP